MARTVVGATSSSPEELTQREEAETDEAEQTASHGFNNDTSNPIVGAYRWLEERFDLQLVNYGRRLIYEFLVPEPAAYWTQLLARRGELGAGDAPTFPALEQDDGSMKSLTVSDLTRCESVKRIVPTSSGFRSSLRGSTSRAVCTWIFIAGGDVSVTFQSPAS
jgi:hypothetical protein